MDGKIKTAASGQAHGNGGREDHHSDPYPNNSTPSTKAQELDTACWYLEIANGLDGKAYLAMLTLALQHIEAAGVAQ